jgi:hypothetical protein
LTDLGGRIAVVVIIKSDILEGLLYHNESNMGISLIEWDLQTNI